MAKHTPGPWKFTEGDAESRAMSPIWAGPGSKIDWSNNRQTLIGWALCDSNVNQRPEDIANARLIAAAPDMLESLRGIVRTVNHLREIMPEAAGGLFRLDLSNAHAAIAKAEGL